MTLDLSKDSYIRYQKYKQLKAGKLTSWASSKVKTWDFPGGAVVKNLPASAGDTGSSPVL